ncbi:RagB/SusD family nutrient uptake outer membrane protein [Sphingobacterium shayense]|uniref:RagB/SusD family nutrient uptake outer membrane protein n=1 Tax=Sphingobacterium shayense TaxID=626343 RepID=UPI001552A390|nr:RagB/SusD family nutrient uptake outer membrane protein [Sphingobacterium shayense]NQD70051.1 RagB/SusD family nutrient uptake outer membrane protein [Sphingobacterium shayense]
MKILRNKYTYCMFAALPLLAVQGCSKDFLKEDLITARNTSDFETVAGIDGLVTGLYQTLKYHFNYEWAYATTNYGTDEFWIGGDRTKEMWGTYNATLNSFTGEAESVWDNMYGAINSANTVIAQVPLVFTNESHKNTRLGEGYFMRAFNYFKLVKQYGGVPLKLDPSYTVQLEFFRNSEQEVYDQIISDFSQAYELLPETGGQEGRVTKWAAAHFLAKVYLFRASELYESWNSGSKEADLQKAVDYGKIVIEQSPHSLAQNFSDLWNYTTPDGANERLPEVILAAKFSNNVATAGRYGNQLHLHFPSVYQTLPGMQRDIAGGREFQRLRTSDYSVDVYDRVNDSRFWKSFKTEYLCNKPQAAPVWDVASAPSPALVNKPKFQGGEVSIKYIVNNADDNRYTQDNIKLRAPHMFVRYFSGNNKDFKGNHGNYDASRYLTMSKFADGSRNSVASQTGYRDGILARVAETYLIVAEALGRQGKYELALPYINTIRERAAYKEGEDRSLYVDGGVAYKTNDVVSAGSLISFSDRNTYFESNNISETTAATTNEMRLDAISEIWNATDQFYDALGVNSNEQKFVAFILNERSRELMGELMRWEDLARTKTLVKRALTFSNEAVPSENKHYYRPIPQSFLDVVQKDGKPLSNDEKQAMQNHGF